MLVGNDVVDLGDAEANLSSLHPRFVERVFSMEERRRIFSSRDRKVILWAYWAAKESAYKALRKLEPEAVFAPSTWVVELERRHGYRDFRGSAGAGRMTFDLEVTQSGEWIHALATIGAGSSGADRILSGVERCPASQDPSIAVRTIAVRALSKRLGLAAEELSVVGSKPPRVVGPAQVDGLDLSLSHHGRWISFAAALP